MWIHLHIPSTAPSVLHSPTVVCVCVCVCCVCVCGGGEYQSAKDKKDTRQRRERMDGERDNG